MPVKVILPRERTLAIRANERSATVRYSLHVPDQLALEEKSKLAYFADILALLVWSVVSFVMVELSARGVTLVTF